MSSGPLSISRAWGRPCSAQRASSTRTSLRPRERGVYLDRSALSREVVDDIQSAKHTAIGQLVGHEVQRPALVRSRRKRKRYSPPGRNPLAQTPSHHQPFVSIKAVHTLVVDLVALAPEQHVKATVPVSRTLASQVEHPLSEPIDQHPVATYTSGWKR